jgi:1-phosphatidylinositol-4-phosphate 5-kinase
VVSKLTNVDDSMFRGDEDISMDSKRKATLHIVDREYAQGVLINEIIKAPLLSSRSMRKSEFKRPGGKIIRGHRSYDLMRDLQLGIRYNMDTLPCSQKT